jgi:hypothetical protein
VIVFRLRSDRWRPPARFLGPILSVLVFGLLGVVTGRGLAWWALAAPIAMVALQPGLRLSDVRVPGLPTLRARTAREASAIEDRRSPLNGLVVGVLALAAIALLPLWRPVGPAGVPAATLSHAPQGIAAKLRALVDAGSVPAKARVWNPQAWGSWVEWALPDVRVAVDSRIELFPPDLWSDVRQAEAGIGEWQSILVDKRPADVVILAATQRPEIRQVLDASPYWDLAYSDADGSIWLRTDLPAAP